MTPRTLLPADAPTVIRSRAARLRTLWVALLCAALALAASATALASAPSLPGGQTLQVQSTDQVAPGLTHTSFQMLTDAGWVTGNTLEADLSEPTLSMDVVDSGSVAAVATVAQQIAGDPSVVAAVNGDYFDMNRTNAPIGTNISATTGVRSIGASGNSLTLSDAGIAAIQRLTSSATATLGGTALPVDAVNSPTVPANGLAYYTQIWGPAPINQLFTAPAVTGVLLTDGVVAQVLSGADAVGAAMPLGQGSGLLIGSGSSAAGLAALQVGDAVDVTVGVAQDVTMAVGGQEILLRDGTVPASDTSVAARNAVGISQDGTHLYIVQVDGRSAVSPGVTKHTMGELLASMGAYNGLNLDGGGSATMLVRASGTSAPALANVPSDGWERQVTNSLVFRSSASPSTLADVRLSTAVADSTTVLPGMTRDLVGVGIAQSGAGVAVDGTFTASSGGTITEQTGTTAVFRAGDSPTTATTAFTAEGKTASLALTVIGALDHLGASSTSVSLQSIGSTRSLTVTGYDADGRAARLEPSDLTISGGTGAATLTPAADGTLTVTGQSVGADTFTISVGGRSVSVGVTVGLEEKPVLDFSDAASWTVQTARATAALSPAAGHDGHAGLRMQYDFTTSTATRGAYAILPADVELAGQPTEVRMWIYGDGSGAWPRIQIHRADGTTANLDGETITWTGWKQVTFTVPAGTAYPIALQRVRIMETRSTASYHGDITISDLTEVVPPDSQPVSNDPVHDAAITTAQTVDGRPLHIAVISDAQFAGAGGSLNESILANLRRSLREIVAAAPDLIVIDGDLVDQADAASFALAQQVLDEEITQKTSTPWIWVPGNHEVMGNPISVFSGQRGASVYSTQVLTSTRVTTLDSSRGTLHADGIDQLAALEAQLDADATDPTVTGEVIFFHMPTDDYLPDKASQLSDRNEAAAFDQMIADWRLRTGKSVAVVNGHVGGFNATSFDGVTQITNGNSGKSPAATADNGGFTGWTMLGINPSAGNVSAAELGDATARTRWLLAQTHPHVDASADPAGGAGVELDLATTELTVGEETCATGTLYQAGIGAIPIGWPVSAQWGGSNATITPSVASGLEAGAQVIRFNPDTSTVTAVAPGTAVLSVTVNGVTATRTITVVGAGTGTEPTPQPTQTASAEPTETATAQPTATSSAEPTATATTSAEPTPTSSPTAGPTDGSTPEPTVTATPVPTVTPSASSTATATATTTAEPTATSSPTAGPAVTPSAPPTPSGSPTTPPATGLTTAPMPSVSPSAAGTVGPVRPRGGAGSTAPGTVPTGGVLARTGLDAAGAAAAAGLLALGGGGLLLARRRRSAD